MHITHLNMHIPLSLRKREKRVNKLSQLLFKVACHQSFDPIDCTLSYGKNNPIFYIQASHSDFQMVQHKL